jgi:hypothetical protein
MHEVLLNQSGAKPIVTFHANTLEYFSLTAQTGGFSYHVGHIKSIEIITDKKGSHTLVTKTDTRTMETDISEQALPKAKELVAAVQDAMKTVKL